MKAQIKFCAFLFCEELFVNFDCKNLLMNTEVKQVPKEMLMGGTSGLKVQVIMRLTPLAEWMNTDVLRDRLSGTLKKNAGIGFKYMGQLEHEALCQTLGWGFESMPTTYVTFNDAVTEGDCPQLTEVGWHVDRLIHTNIFDDVFELKYINIQDTVGNILRQGVGVIVRETSVQWVKKGNLVFTLLTEFNPKTGQWSDCVNPF